MIKRAQQLVKLVSGGAADRQLAGMRADQWRKPGRHALGKVKPGRIAVGPAQNPDLGPLVQRGADGVLGWDRARPERIAVQVHGAGGDLSPAGRHQRGVGNIQSGRLRSKGAVVEVLAFHASSIAESPKEIGSAPTPR